MSEPNTLDEAKRVISGLVTRLLETQEMLIEAQQKLLQGEGVKYSVSLEGLKKAGSRENYVRSSDDQ